MRSAQLPPLTVILLGNQAQAGSGAQVQRHQGESRKFSTGKPVSETSCGNPGISVSS